MKQCANIRSLDIFGVIYLFVSATSIVSLVESSQCDVLSYSSEVYQICSGMEFDYASPSPTEMADIMKREGRGRLEENWGVLPFDPFYLCCHIGCSEDYIQLAICPTFQTSSFLRRRFKRGGKREILMHLILYNGEEEES